MFDGEEKLLESAGEILLYGQEDYAARVRKYLELLYPDISIREIVFALEKDQPDGTEFDFDSRAAELDSIDRKVTVFAAFSLKYIDTVKDMLREKGFKDIICYSPRIDNWLKTRYFRRYYRGKGQEFLVLSDMEDEHEAKDCSVKVYMAEGVFDKPLREKPKLSDHIVPIQVGAALTDKRIADVADDMGENISSKNRCYAEMTALYWIWRHADADYVGLCHYRRLFEDLDGIADKLQRVDVDALMPLPTLSAHTVYEDYLLKHIPDAWRPLMDVVKEQSPDYYAAAERIFHEPVFYASNMFILRRDVMDDLCSWMFPILQETEQRVGDLDGYYRRYIGFGAERLVTLYFLYNKHDWRIAHVNKIFLG